MHRYSRHLKVQLVTAHRGLEPTARAEFLVGVATVRLAAGATGAVVRAPAPVAAVVVTAAVVTGAGLAAATAAAGMAAAVTVAAARVVAVRVAAPGAGMEAVATVAVATAVELAVARVVATVEAAAVVVGMVLEVRVVVEREIGQTATREHWPATSID